MSQRSEVILSHLCVQPSAARPQFVAALSALPPAGSAPPLLHHTLSLRKNTNQTKESHCWKNTGKQEKHLLFQGG